REVGLEEDVLRADALELRRREGLEPAAGVDLAPEVLARQQPEVAALPAHRHRAELVVRGLEQEGKPADAALDRDEAELGEALEDAAEEQVEHVGAVRHEELRARAGRGRRVALALDAVRRELVAEVAAADVEADREAAGLRRGPDRVPVP